MSRLGVKTGLVMEGGAMRGMFTAGVIDVLMENEITFDGAIGVSAGATFGCNIKSHQIGRPIRYNCNYCKDYRYGSAKSFFKTGDLFDVEFCYHELPDKLDVFDTDTFTKNPMEFYVVATDVEAGEPVYYKCYDGKGKDIDWIRASASIPLVSNIVELDGKKLLDGGISDAVPLSYFESIGYEKNVVILTQPDDYRKSKNKATPLCKIVYRNYPKFVELFENRHDRYNENVEYIRKKEKENTAFVIRPKEKLGVKSAEKDPEKLKAAYELGRAAAIEAMEERGLKEWMNL